MKVCDVPIVVFPQAAPREVSQAEPSYCGLGLPALLVPTPVAASAVFSHQSKSCPYYRFRDEESLKNALGLGAGDNLQAVFDHARKDANKIAGRAGRVSPLCCSKCAIAAVAEPHGYGDENSCRKTVLRKALTEYLVRIQVEACLVPVFDTQV
jgi:hypothetical protein